MIDNRMTVKRLIELLQEQDPKANPVVWVAFEGEDDSGTMLLDFHGTGQPLGSTTNPAGVVCLSVGPIVEGERGTMMQRLMAANDRNRYFGGLLDSIRKRVITLQQSDAELLEAIDSAIKESQEAGR